MRARRGFGAVWLLTVAVWLLAAAASAGAAPTYHHSIHRAMGLLPAHGTIGHYVDPAVGSQSPVVYRGGSTMTTGTVTIHTIFWAPPGYHFTGSPSAGVLGYEPLVKQFFSDAAQASGLGTNLFSVLDQYGEPSVPGHYSIAYNSATDSIDDATPYPSTADQCASPAGTRTCLTDGEVSHEIDRVIQTTDPSGRGLHNLWEVFLPPDVDECIDGGTCGTDYYAAYHSDADWGHGPFMYALMVDPMIEYTPLNGSDPEGNPDAESAIDAAAHETVESMTDPEGTGWTTTYSYEIGDVCETQYGAPLGYATDGSPYNQLINGHAYEIQDMWANSPIGCVQSSPATADRLPLPTVSFTQFSSRVSGSIARPLGGVAVRIELFRGFTVAKASGRTRSNGSWGPLVLRDSQGRQRAVGDDRDLIAVNYGSGGPPDDEIATGSGGDPFAEAGWTGWADLDASALVSRHSVTVGPCFQTGVFTVTVNGSAIASPTPECNTQTDTATVSTPRLTDASRVVLSNLDNRAASELAPDGALVRLTVPLGEPNSTGSATGLPYCSAQLRLQVTVCNGLVGREHYRLTNSRGHVVRHARADFSGVARFSGFRITGGDVLTLTNPVGRVITRLQVAHLRVGIHGDESVISSGTCQPGDYWGGPFGLSGSSLSQVLILLENGYGVGPSQACGRRGRAKGAPAHQIEQQDEQSGGFTSTSVPQLGTHIPAANTVINSGFRALAGTGFRGPAGGFVPAVARVSLSIIHGGRTVFHARNVERRGGVSVPRLATGNYWAKWVVSDRNGDTRTVFTRFEEG